MTKITSTDIDRVRRATTNRMILDICDLAQTALRPQVLVDDAAVARLREKVERKGRPHPKPDRKAK